MTQHDTKEIVDLKVSVATLTAEIKNLVNRFDDPKHCVQVERITKIESDISYIKWIGGGIFTLVSGWSTGLFRWIFSKI